MSLMGVGQKKVPQMALWERERMINILRSPTPPPPPPPLAHNCNSTHHGQTKTADSKKNAKSAKSTRSFTSPFPPKRDSSPKKTPWEWVKMEVGGRGSLRKAGAHTNTHASAHRLMHGQCWLQMLAKSVWRATNVHPSKHELRRASVTRARKRQHSGAPNNVWTEGGNHCIVSWWAGQVNNNSLCKHGNSPQKSGCKPSF